MIAIRKETSAFADFNNRYLLDIDNEHLFGFIRFDHSRPSERVLVICNFSDHPEHIDLQTLSTSGFSMYGQLTDLYSGKSPTKFKNHLVLQPYHFYWLSEH